MSGAEERIAAAQVALAAGDVESALRDAHEAVACDGGAHAHELLGVLRYLEDDVDGARSNWEAAFRLHRGEGRLREAARCAIDLARLHGILGRHAAAGGWVERARALLDRVGPCVEQGYLELALMACDRPDIDDLLASSERALATAFEFGDSDLEVQALADSGLGLVASGRCREGFARLDAALAAITAGEVGPASAGISFCSMLTACDRAGDVRRATEWAQLVRAVIGLMADRPRALHTHCRVAYGSVLSAAGQWIEAEALIIEALGPADSPSVTHRALAVAHLADLRLGQGRVDEAADLLAPFEDQLTSCGPLARVHLARGETDLAAAVIHRGRSELVGDVLRSAPLVATLVQVELARGDVRAAAAAADDLEELAAAVDLGAIRALAATSRARVAAAAAAGDADARPASHAAAVAAYAEAIRLLADDERPLELATVRLELAEVVAAAGEAPRAIVEARAAAAAFERLGAARLRDRAAALLRSLGDTGRPRAGDTARAAASLTAREREVLALISQGLTNAEIADRLYISRKTAEHHVGRVLAKLGVRSRAEAAALAVRLAALGPE